MKKILAIIILSIFFISILGSALPEVNLIVLRMSSDQKYKEMVQMFWNLKVMVTDPMDKGMATS